MNITILKKTDFQRSIFNVIIIILAIVILWTGFISAAKSTRAEQDSHKYFKSIEIHYGDTLWSIAVSHMPEEYSSVNDYILEIIQLNSLDNTEIHAGEYIVIPYYLSY